MLTLRLPTGRIAQLLPLALLLLAPACGRGADTGRSGTSDPAAQSDSAKLDSLSDRRRGYELTRAEACRKVYDEQHARFSNVVGYKYDGEVDGCWVIYRYDPPKTTAQCDSMFPPEETSFIAERLLCHEGRYRTRF